MSLSLNPAGFPIALALDSPSDSFLPSDARGRGCISLTTSSYLQHRRAGSLPLSEEYLNKVKKHSLLTETALEHQ